MGLLRHTGSLDAGWVCSPVLARSRALGLLTTTGSLRDAGSTALIRLAGQLWVYYLRLARFTDMGLLCRAGSLPSANGSLSGNGATPGFWLAR